MMEQIRGNIDAMRDQLVESIRELVAVESVGGDPEPGAPFGPGPKAAMDKFVEIAGRMGFSTGTFENMVGWGEWGDGDAEMVGILAHVDVVPPGEGWSCDPWEGKIEDGFLYGRGVADNKGEAICALVALKAIVDAGVKLKRRVRVLVGTNEERGSKAVRHYVTSGQELPLWGFTPDAEYPLINGEKGSFTARLSAPFVPSGAVQILSFQGGVAANAVPDKATAELSVTPALEGRVRRALSDWAPPRGAALEVEDRGQGQFLLTMKGQAAHGSRPHLGCNAVAQLVKVLRLCGLVGEQGLFLDKIDQLVGDQCFGENLQLCRHDDVTGFSSLCWGTMVKDGPRVFFTLNYRFPVAYKLTPLQAQFESAMEAAGFTIESINGDESLYVAEDDPLVVNLMKAYQQETGRQGEKPLAIGGGTYAKAMPNILAFGSCLPGEDQHIHEADERWSIDNIVLTTKIMAAAILNLAEVQD